MNSQLRLYDIEGLDSISWWPLATGWWVVIAIIVVTSLAIIAFYTYRKLAKLKWQYNTLKQLDKMKHNLTEGNSHQVIIELSQIIRRIAVYKYSRLECAGLQGEEWLKWLKEHDKNNFDWFANAKILIEATYAPEGTKVSITEINKIIDATKGWVE